MIPAEITASNCGQVKQDDNDKESNAIRGISRRRSKLRYATIFIFGLEPFHKPRPKGRFVPC